MRGIESIMRVQAPGREIDEPPAFLFPETRRSMAADIESALEVHGDHCIPLRLGHIEDHAISQDAGHVDNDVDAAKLFHRLVDHLLGLVIFRDVAIVSHSMTARGLDFINDLLRGRGILPLACERNTQVVDDDRCTFACQRHCHAAPDPSPGARDERCLAIQFSHRNLVCRLSAC
jgi:hypothetical protein